MLEEIPNFPQTFMDRHMNWHTNDPQHGGRTIPQGQPGSGAEFLDFHHQFITDVKTWYAGQPGADLAKLAAWSELPPDLAAAHSPELANFQSYAATAANFTSEDALGIYVEHEHNFVHGYIAGFYATPAFGGFDSCMFFMFYQWHGMIDAWRGNWLVHHKSAVKDLKERIKDFKELEKFNKELIADSKPLRDVIKEIEIPPKSPKEAAETPGVPDFGDLAAHLTNLGAQVSRLEAVVHRQAFIRQDERPQVG